MKWAVLGLLFILFVSGCTTSHSDQCTTDGDCGELKCTDSMTAISTPTCVNGACLDNDVDCELNQICVQDSTGIECQNKTDSGSNVLSCNTNAANARATGKNPFNPATFICQDDCPPGTFCDAASCLCTAKKLISCYEYTDATTNPMSPFLWTKITNIFNPAKEICSPDCKEGYICKTPKCTCELDMNCGLDEPKFYTSYFPDSPKPDVDSLANLIMGGNLDFSGFGPTIKIPALEFVEVTPTTYIPFPRDQLDVHPGDDPMVVIGGYCANEYFSGPKAIDINAVVLTEPTREESFCRWGGITSHEGVLEMCTDDLEEWILGVSQMGILF